MHNNHLTHAFIITNFPSIDKRSELMIAFQMENQAKDIPEIQTSQPSPTDLTPTEKMRLYKISKLGIEKREKSRKRRGQGSLTKDQMEKIAPQLEWYLAKMASMDAEKRRAKALEKKKTEAEKEGCGGDGSGL
jgi:hypothetical protein